MKNSICLLIISFLILLIAFLAFKYYKLSSLLEPYRPVMIGMDSSTKGSTEDAANYLIELSRKSSDLNMYYENLQKNDKIDIEPISRSSANNYHTNYRNSLQNPGRDTTKAVLFEFPKIIKTLLIEYPGKDLRDSNFWKDKGFFIYLSNYGNTGRSSATVGNPIGSDRYQTSCILQLAQIDSSTTTILDDWKVLSSGLFNFGDIRPPKKISNTSDTPE